MKLKLKITPVAAHLGRCALLATLSSMPLPAMADYDTDRSHPGLYLGGGAGLNSLNGEDYTAANNDVTDDQVSYKGIVGFRVNSNVSLEAGYVDFGTAQDGNNHVQAHGFTLGGVLEVPALQFVHPYAKAGFLFWDADSQFSAIQQNDTGSDFTYGAGLRFILGDTVDVRTEYDRFEMDRNNVNTISVALQFNF